MNILPYGKNEYVVIIKKVKEEGGCWSNMAPYSVTYEDMFYHTSESLFQCLRFVDEEIRRAIREEKNPMKSKMIAKKYAHKMTIKPMSDKDLDNMRLCLKLKLEQHPELLDKLKDTGNHPIIEDCTNRQHGSGLFWGAAKQSDGSWVGLNQLGELWMEIRRLV